MNTRLIEIYFSIFNKIEKYKLKGSYLFIIIIIKMNPTKNSEENDEIKEIEGIKVNEETKENKENQENAQNTITYYIGNNEIFIFKEDYDMGKNIIKDAAPIFPRN